MTSTLIIIANPDAQSFTHAWAKASEEAARTHGHDVATSDLYAMGFDPVLPTTQKTDLDQSVTGEIAKVRAADNVIFHFPIWWFDAPAMLKGWFDRVLADGELHSVENRFDKGPCRGKRALFCVSTGASKAECKPDGKEGNLEMILWPNAYALRYCGFSVLKPIAVHSVYQHPTAARQTALETDLKRALDEQVQIIANLGRLPEIAFNADTEFTKDGSLKPGAPSHSPFIQHM